VRVLVDTHLLLWAVASSRRLPNEARSLILSELPVTAAHAARVAGLPAIHRDPFDRLLVAQSLAEPMTLLTNDAVLEGYGPFVQLV
jgi:PIN domain nuclease of toxin-antitoxin system